jgi:hypothetical protein
MDASRLGARMLRHPIEGLEEIHQGMRPIRARLWHERAQQMGQQIGQQGSANQAAQSGTVGSYNDQAGDVNDFEGSPSIGDEAGLPVGDTDGGGVLEFVGDAIEWFGDLF